MKKAMIFGISGQDGAYLSEFLLAKGYRVVGTSRDALMAQTSNLRTLGIHDQVQLLSVSPKDFRSVVDALKSHVPDEIYNLSGQSSVGLSFQQPLETFESICTSTVNILESIRLLELPARLYNACSSDCFGTCAEPANERTAFRPTSPYAVAKSAAFWQVANYRQSYELYAVSGILSNHESPLRPKHYVTRKIVRGALQVARGQADCIHLGNIEIRRDWGWAPEYVEAMWLMLQQKVPSDYVVATGRTHSLREFAEAVCKKLSLTFDDLLRIDHSLFRPSDIENSWLSPAKAERELGWKARTDMFGVAEKMLEFESRTG
jgi:GDPmannose 4,6-dehydratase